MGEQRRQAKEKTVKKGEDRTKKTARMYTLSPPPTPVHPHPPSHRMLYVQATDWSEVKFGSQEYREERKQIKLHRILFRFGLGPQRTMPG